ncbi:MAG: protein-glutamate O-methyltransferase CheR [Proteobacteria bacterium]|nr:MAG: protein-glutamate O-methyltransferase CheR [Pseudomonadota bacterium]
MPALELSPPVFSILSGLIEEKLGLHYGLPDRDLLREKASARAQEAGFDSLLDYYYFLRYDPAGATELSGLSETLVVNETYFFREWPAVQTVVEKFIAPWCAQGKRPRVWSAACSTGEEPLSLAMLLKEKNLLDQVEIVASDLSERVLKRAQSGAFGRRSVRQVPNQDLLNKFIKPTEDGYAVDRSLVEAVKWRQRNLLQANELAELGKFDIILCRNVLIYFADATVKNVLASLGDSLEPGGALVVGVSESLLRYGTKFFGEEVNGSFVYRKGERA